MTGGRAVCTAVNAWQSTARKCSLLFVVLVLFQSTISTIIYCRFTYCLCNLCCFVILKVVCQILSTNIYEMNFTLCVLLVYNDNGSVQTLCITRVSALCIKCLHRPIVIINQQYTKGEIHFIYLHYFHVF